MAEFYEQRTKCAGAQKQKSNFLKIFISLSHIELRVSGIENRGLFSTKCASSTNYGRRPVSSIQYRESSIEYPVSSIQYRVSSAQKELNMQNKPNLLNTQINVSVVITKYYENIPLSRGAENKPNSKPIQTQFQPPCAENKPNQTQFQTSPAFS